MAEENKKETSNGLVYFAIFIGLIAVSASFFVIYKQVLAPNQGENTTQNSSGSISQLGNKTLSQEIIKSADGTWSTYINRMYDFEVGYSTAIQVYGQFFDDPEKYVNTSPPTPFEINKGNSIQPYFLVKVTDTHGKEVSVPLFGSGLYKVDEDITISGVPTKISFVKSNKQGEALVRYNAYSVFKKGSLQFELYLTGIPVGDGARYEATYKKSLGSFKVGL